MHGVLLAVSLPSVKQRRQFDFGPYKTPRFRYGAVVQCEVRGEVVIAGLSNGRIAWPIGRRRGERTNGYIVYKDLARALRKESARTVQYWFGLGHGTVSTLRKALGVPIYNEGTRRAISRATQMPLRSKNIRKAIAKAGDPKRREKISAALRARPRPKHLIEAMQRGRQAFPASAETRRKLSEAMKRKGIRPPKGVLWTADEEKLLREDLSHVEVAQRLGRTVRAIRQHRLKLGIWRSTAAPRVPWTPGEDELFRQGLSNQAIAERTGRPQKTVNQRRYKLKVKKDVLVATLADQGERYE